MNQETRVTASETVVVADRSTQRRRRLVIGGFVALCLLALGLLLFGGGSGESSAGGAQAGAAARGGGQVPTVSVTVPGRSQVARVITASGALAARRDQPVGAAGAGGRVTAVLVDAGDRVSAGQVLARVDRSVQSQQAAQLAAAVESARASAALAESEYERSAALVDRGFISRAEIDRKQSALEQARAQVRVAQAQLNATRAGIGLLDVRAPTSGLVLERNLEVGQVIGPGSQNLFRIAQGGDMEMQAQLPQQDLAAVRVGLPAEVRPVGSDQSFTGRVWQVAPVIDPQSRLGAVRIAVPYSPVMRPGGFAEARITAGATTAPLLPQSAVLSDSDGNYVYVVNGRNEVERRAIRVGSVDEAGVTIAEGLTGQEAVVVSAGPFLNPGQKINPRRQAAAQ